MASSTVHVLKFASQDFPNDSGSNLMIISDQDILGVWMGECFEDPELTLVVLAGFPDGFDSQLFSGLTPKQHQQTEMPTDALVQCLDAPVTEIASMVLKADCDHVQATFLVNEAMQTVLDADDCTGAVWKTSANDAIFFVGWKCLEAHEKYHHTIFASPPDCIRQLPGIVETNLVLHVALRSIQAVVNKTT